MTFDTILAFSAAACAGTMAFVSLFLRRRSVAAWCFVVGMILLAGDSVFNGLSVNAADPEKVRFWQGFALGTKSLVPGVWLCFSISYSRGNFQKFLGVWRTSLVATIAIPVILALGFAIRSIHVLPIENMERAWWLGFHGSAQWLNICLLVGSVLILMNLEQTFRATVGTMRWQIKFTILGLAVIFGARIYTRSQTVLFNGYSLALTGVESAALLMGCALMAAGYVRSKTAEIDVYPSQAVLRTSLTVLIVGSYLFVVGVLAQLVTYLGGAKQFRAQAFLVLVAISILAMLLLSDRLRLGVHRLVARHFRKAQHDTLKLWTLFSQGLATVKTTAALAEAAVRLVSKSFEVLTVNLWLVDEEKQRLILSATTNQVGRSPAADHIPLELPVGGLLAQSSPFNLETAVETWAPRFRENNIGQFQHGGDRLGLPFVSGGKCLGVMVLADRVNGVPYSIEERDLLKCIGEQITSGLVNLRLTDELLEAKELEAFRTMSAFFVHDLKNAASGLNLMLKNFPIHFEDPEFRKDALRSVGNTVARIDQLVNRLSALRKNQEMEAVEFDLNELVLETLAQLEGSPSVVITQDPQRMMILADREQIQSVVTNLLLNARDAVSKDGQIRVQTLQRHHQAVLSIEDDGCGMSSAFVNGSLFRPFQSTKKKGLGIGMFQSKIIVEAHRGSIQVESTLGKGTTFRITLPLTSRN